MDTPSQPRSTDSRTALRGTRGRSGAPLCTLAAALMLAASGASAVAVPGPEDPPASSAAQAQRAAERPLVDLPLCRPDWDKHVVSITGHRRAPVVSAWLTNGVRVHHQRLESAPGAVFVTVSFVGGELRETAANRGISVGACAAWDEFSVSGLSPARIPAALEGRAIRIAPIAGPDVIQLRVSCARSDLDEAMRVVSVLLTRPRITPEGLAATIAGGAKQIKTWSSREDSLVAEAIFDAVYPEGDARLRPPTRQQLDAVTVEAAQAWLDEHLASAPVEAAIVGDITLDEAMRFAAGYLSDLAPRERVSPEAFSLLRRQPPLVYPVVRELRRSVEPDRAIVVVGFPGAEASRPTELRIMRVAARVLDERATAALHAAGFAGAEVGAAAIPASVYPGYGVVVVNSKCECASAEVVAAAMMGAIERLVAEGALESEVKSAAEELAKAVEQYERQPRYWAGILARSDSTGIDIDDVADGPAYYRSLTADRINTAIRSSYADGRTLRLIIRSDGSGDHAPQEAGPAADAPSTRR